MRGFACSCASSTLSPELVAVAVAAAQTRKREKSTARFRFRILHETFMAFATCQHARADHVWGTPWTCLVLLSAGVVRPVGMLCSVSRSRAKEQSGGGVCWGTGEDEHRPTDAGTKSRDHVTGSAVSSALVLSLENQRDSRAKGAAGFAAHRTASHSSFVR